jgi:hypothetical protein
MSSRQRGTFQRFALGIGQVGKRTLIRNICWCLAFVACYIVTFRKRQCFLQWSDRGALDIGHDIQFFKQSYVQIKCYIRLGHKLVNLRLVKRQVIQQNTILIFELLGRLYVFKMIKGQAFDWFLVATKMHGSLRDSRQNAATGQVTQIARIRVSQQ